MNIMNENRKDIFTKEEEFKDFGLSKVVYHRFTEDDFVTRDLTTDGKEDPAKVAAWKAEFSDWFIEDAAFFYYLYTLRYTMVDNRAKNSFWHYGKVAVKNAETGLYEYAKDTDGNFIYKFDFQFLDFFNFLATKIAHTLAYVKKMLYLCSRIRK